MEQTVSLVEDKFSFNRENVNRLEGGIFMAFSMALFAFSMACLAFSEIGKLKKRIKELEDK